MEYEVEKDVIYLIRESGSSYMQLQEWETMQSTTVLVHSHKSQLEESPQIKTNDCNFPNKQV